MKKIILEIDKPILEFTHEELKALQWVSVDDSEFAVLTARELYYCSATMLNAKAHVISKQSNDVYFEIFRRELKKVVLNKSSYWSTFNNLLTTFLPDTFYDELHDEILEMFMFYGLKRGVSGFDGTKWLLIQRGLLDICKTPIDLSYLTESTNEHTTNISKEDWCDIYNNTNYLFYAFKENEISEMFPLIMTTKEMKSLGIPAIPVLDVAKFNERHNKYWDYDDLQAFISKNPNQVYTWDEMLTAFYTGKASSDVLTDFWMYAWNTHDEKELSTEVLNSLYKSEVSDTISEMMK